jgi:hypothetical protein
MSFCEDCDTYLLMGIRNADGIGDVDGREYLIEGEERRLFLVRAGTCAGKMKGTTCSRKEQGS